MTLELYFHPYFKKVLGFCLGHKKPTIDQMLIVMRQEAAYSTNLDRLRLAGMVSGMNHIISMLYFLRTTGYFTSRELEHQLPFTCI